MYLSYCEKNIGTHLHSNKLARCVFFNYWSKNTHILKEYKEKLSLFDDINDCYDIKWDPIYDREPDDWDCFFLSLNPNITWDIVQSNPNKSWNYAMLSKNPNITWNNGVNLVQSNPHPVPERTALAGGTSSLYGPACGNGKDWDYNMLSKNPNITWDIVKENPDRAWDYDELSRHHTITWNIVLSNPNKPWNYVYLSSNPNITLDIVKENPGIDWDYSWLSLNPNITMDIVKENPGIDWNYNWLSKNQNITWEIVKENTSIDWNYYFLSQNPNITWDIVKENPYPNGEHSSNTWNYNMLSKNPNITWDIAKQNEVIPELHFPELKYYKKKNWNYILLLISRKIFDETINGVNLEKIKNIISHFKTNITEELMIYVWNPIRVEKWKYLVDDEEV